MTPKPMLSHPIASPAELMAEVLLLRPEIRRVLAEHPHLRNAPCMEDRLQVVLLKMTRYLATYAPHEDGVRPLVVRIAHNVKLDAVRARESQRAALGTKMVQFDPDELASDAASIERRVRARELLRKVVPIIADMPPRLRAVLLLVAWAGLKQEEVARQLDIRHGAVRTRLVRAREYLRERIGTLDEHLAVLAPVPIQNAEALPGWPRRALMRGSQFVHLWPPLLLGVVMLSQMEQPELPPTRSTTVEVTEHKQFTTAMTVATVSILATDDTSPPKSVPSAHSASNVGKMDSRVRITVEPPRKTLWWRKTR